MVNAPPTARSRKGSYVRFALATLPWIGFLVCIPFVNRVEPFILGMPFLLFWMVLWVLLTAGCMSAVYLTDPANKKENER